MTKSELEKIFLEVHNEMDQQFNEQKLMEFMLKNTDEGGYQAIALNASMLAMNYSKKLVFKVLEKALCQ